MMSSVPKTYSWFSLILKLKIKQYHYKNIPKINNKNIIRKSKHIRHYPAVIATKAKFIKPNYGYNEYICSEKKKQYISDPTTNQSKLNDIPYIEFSLNPSGNFIHEYKDLAKQLVKNAEGYKGTSFGSKIKSGFFESFKMFHRYLYMSHIKY